MLISGAILWIATKGPKCQASTGSGMPLIELSGSSHKTTFVFTEIRQSRRNHED
jgi:hypothetical protein